MEHVGEVDMNEIKHLKTPPINGAIVFAVSAIIVGSVIFAIDDYASRCCGMAISLIGVAMVTAASMTWHNDCYNAILDTIDEIKVKP